MKTIINHEDPAPATDELMITVNTFSLIQNASMAYAQAHAIDLEETWC